MAGRSLPRVGVLALQGDVREHENLLAQLGADVVRIRTAADLSAVDGLVLPGGESSVIDKLARAFDLHAPLSAAIASGMPVLGTCAGLILLADEIADASPGQQSFGGLNVRVRRNAFGRQSESFYVPLSIPALGAPPVMATFIRAPIVEEVGSEVQVLAALPTGEIVAVEQQRIIGLSFHPEVDREPRFHLRFLDQVRAVAGG